MNALFGGPFLTHAKRVAVWEQAARIPGCDKALWRCDAQGRVIRWADYGDHSSQYGWEMRARPRAGVLARALNHHRMEALHWCGLPGDETRRPFDLPWAA